MGLSPRQLDGLAYYESRYDIILDQPLVADRPFQRRDHLSEQDRRCRFCGLSSPNVTFRSVSHAVPEFLGNKSLISLNECDGCNKLLANNYEDHLAKWFGPLRAISQISGKGGVPTYKDKGIDQGGRIRIEMADCGLKLSIVGTDLNAQFDKAGPHAFTLPVETPSQPYVPIRAAMALVKAACSLCPAEELHECATAIDWLMARLSARISKFPVLFAFTPGPNPYVTGRVMMLRRKVNEPIPYLWCIIATANYRFQFFVPFCPSDTGHDRRSEYSFQARHFPIPFSDDWQYGPTQFGMLDLAGEEAVVNNPKVTLNVDRAEVVNDSDQS